MWDIGWNTYNRTCPAPAQLPALKGPTDSYSYNCLTEIPPLLNILHKGKITYVVNDKNIGTKASITHTVLRLYVED